MMYLLFLSSLYVWNGGRWLTFFRILLGYDEPEEPRKKVRVPAGPERPSVGDGEAESDNDRPELPLVQSEKVYGTGGRAVPLSGNRFKEGSLQDAQAFPEASSVNRSSGGSSAARALPSLDDMDVGSPQLATRDTGKSWLLSREERDVLKRRAITARVNPMVVLSSFVSDLDVATDWTFLDYVLVDFSVGLQRAGLAFAIIGTVMWALSTTEFAVFSHLKLLWYNNNPMSRVQYTGLGKQLLLNVVAEDLPQFVITAMTKPNSVFGVLNIVTSTFSLIGKVVKGMSSKSEPSLSTQFHMIDADPAVTRHLFELTDDAKRKTEMAEKLVYLTWKYRNVDGETRAATVFQVMQLDPTFINGDLEYMKAELFDGNRLALDGCSLYGQIPPELGGYHITTLVLRNNHLSGHIPRELFSLTLLQELDLSKNELEGTIPKEIANLGNVEVISLAGNELSGTIPAELAQLQGLKVLDLSDNRLTGEIPMELGKLEWLRSFNAGNNLLQGATWAERKLRLMLHQECHTELLPQDGEEPKEGLKEEVV